MLKKNEEIKETIKEAASELSSVNEVLKQEKVPVQTMKQAFTQNENVEQKVAEAAIDLKLVNVELAEETADVLFKNADTAMYKAKGTGKRMVLFRESGEGKAIVST